MYEFKYSKFSRFFYRWINIPASFILIIFILFSFAMVFENINYIFPLIIDIAVLIKINSFFIKSHKYFPFKISANNEKIVCTDFFDKSKIVEIYHKDITNISGGIFSNNLAKPIYIFDENHNQKIGLHSHLKDSNKLLTIILSNIRKELYDSLLEKMKIQKGDFQNKVKKKKKKK